MSLTLPPDSHDDWVDELYQVIKEGDVHSFMELVSTIPAEELRDIRFEVSLSIVIHRAPVTSTEHPHPRSRGCDSRPV